MMTPSDKRVDYKFDIEGARAAYRAEIETMIAKKDVFERCIPHERGYLGSQNREGQGAWVEVLFRQFLANCLPDRLEVVSGFILNSVHGRTSAQMDVIVYDSQNYSPVVKYGDAAIVESEAVLAAISVKRRLRTSEVEPELATLVQAAKLAGEDAAPGPYTALVGFERDPASKTFKKFMDSVTGKYIDFHKRLEKLPERVSYHEIVDSVVTLDGLRIHASTHKKNNKKNWGKRTISRTGDSPETAYLIAAELLSGIQERLVARTGTSTNRWESLRKGKGMGPTGKAIEYCTRFRPFSE